MSQVTGFNYWKYDDVNIFEDGLCENCLFKIEEGDIVFTGGIIKDNIIIPMSNETQQIIRQYGTIRWRPYYYAFDDKLYPIVNCGRIQYYRITNDTEYNRENMRNLIFYNNKFSQMIAVGYLKDRKICNLEEVYDNYSHIEEYGIRIKLNYFDKGKCRIPIILNICTGIVVPRVPVCGPMEYNLDVIFYDKNWYIIEESEVPFLYKCLITDDRKLIGRLENNQVLPLTDDQMRIAKEVNLQYSYDDV